MENSTTTTTERTETYSEVKSRIRQNALDNAVCWAQSLALCEGQMKAMKFELGYIEQVLSVVGAGMSKGGEEEKTILTHIATRDKFIGKSVLVEGKKYQPTISFGDNIYTDQHGNKITDLVKIGKHKLVGIFEDFRKKNTEVATLVEQRKLLRWKQKFHRYCYNFNDTEMTKYHDKISEFESGQLDWRTEADAEGREIKVVRHKITPQIGRETELDSMDSGFEAKALGDESATVDNGGQLKDYADSIKSAYDQRVAIIKTTKIMLSIPVSKRKLIKLPTTTVNTENGADVMW